MAVHPFTSPPPSLSTPLLPSSFSPQPFPLPSPLLSSLPPLLKDVFTVSVGNLPPGANVLIKITYVAELSVDGENIVFTLPGSVAPWKQEAALEETTQSDVEKIKVKEQG